MVGSSYTYVQVEPNENSPMMASLVYKTIGPAYRVARVRIYEGTPEGTVCRVTGWSSADGGTPVPAYTVPVEDSGQGIAHLVYGGDWGIRLQPVDSTNEWQLDDPGQWGETHLVLADASDAIREAED